MTDIEPIDATLEELEANYPVGTIVQVRRAEEEPAIGPREFEAVVTGHHTVEQSDGSVKYKYPGPRVDVSSNPPGYEWQFPKASVAAALRPCEIVDVVGRVDEA